MLPKRRKRPITISLNQYVSNPTGKGSGNVVARYRIRESLNRAFVNILRHQRKKFQATPYIFSDKIIWHVVVPSETGNKGHSYQGLTYDVFIELKGSNSDRGRRNCKLWSNSPSFTFTYAYVYYHTDIMVEDLANKFQPIVLNQAPEMRNPNETLGYEKSTYFAARYLIEGGCLTDKYLSSKGIVGTDQLISQIYSRVLSPDAKTQAANVFRKADVSTIKGADLKNRKMARDNMKRGNITNTKDINRVASSGEKIKKVKPKDKSVKPDSVINYISSKKSNKGRRTTSRGTRSNITARKAQKSLMGKKKR